MKSLSELILRVRIEWFWIVYGLVPEKYKKKDHWIYFLWKMRRMSKK